VVVCAPAELVRTALMHVTSARTAKRSKDRPTRRVAI
jgi:hypothetical protein